MIGKRLNRVSGLSKSRGLTLIEVLTSSFLILLLTLNLFWMVTAGMTTWYVSVTRSANHQNLRMAMSRITLDMKDSSYSLFTNNTGSTPKAFSFLSAVDSNGSFTTASDGKPVWQKYIIYYVPSGKTNLLRKEVYGTFTTPLTSSQLTTYCDGNGKLIAPNVTAMTVVPNAANKSISFSVTLSDKNKVGKTDTQSLNETVYLRN